MHESVIETVHLKVNAGIETMLQSTAFVDKVTEIMNSLVDKTVGHMLQSPEMQNAVAKMLHKAGQNITKASVGTSKDAYKTFFDDEENARRL